MLKKKTLRMMAAAAAVILTAGSAQAAGTPEEIQKKVPQAFVDKGALTVAQLSDFAPFSSVKDGALVGAWTELAAAIVEVLGLKMDAQPANFDVMLTGIAAKRFDVGYGGFYVNPKRLQAADFVADFRDIDSFVALESSGLKVSGFKDLCGRKIAVMIGSAHLAGVEKSSAECEAAGEPKIEILTFPSMYNAVLAVSSRRADLSVTNLGISAPIMANDKSLVTVGDFTSGLTAAAFRKDEESRALQDAWGEAIDYLIESGKYKEILEKWNVQYGAIPGALIYRDEADLNGADHADLPQ